MIEIQGGPTIAATIEGPSGTPCTYIGMSLLTEPTRTMTKLVNYFRQGVNRTPSM